MHMQPARIPASSSNCLLGVPRASGSLFGIWKRSGQNAVTLPFLTYLDPA